MNIEDITAESMKKLATKEDSDDINSILTLIKEQAEKGETKLHLSDYDIKGTTKKELELRGFKVEVGGRYNETNTVIMWS